MRAIRIAWINAGRPRGQGNPLFAEYKNAKKIFRNKLRSLYRSLESEFFNEIDKAANCDQSLFWNLINRNKNRRNRIIELRIGHKILRTPEEITTVWAEYFADLYTPKDSEHFDNNHKYFAERSIREMKRMSYSNHKQILDDDISTEEVIRAVKSLKHKKPQVLTLSRTNTSSMEVSLSTHT